MAGKTRTIQRVPCRGHDLIIMEGKVRDHDDNTIEHEILMFTPSDEPTQELTLVEDE